MNSGKPYTDSFTGPSFSLKNRMGRALWKLVYILFFRPSPVPFHVWRSLLLRLFGARVGRGAHIYPDVRIWAPWNLVLGDRSGVGSGAILYSQEKIFIGYKAVISQYAFLCTGTHDYERWGMPVICKPIIVEAHVWVAASAFVHPGITLGEGCVIGAGSVVTRDMPSWMVCYGHPCIPVKKRNISQ